MQSEWIYLGSSEVLALRGEALPGHAGEQLSELLVSCEMALSKEGLSSDDIVFQRLWHRSRDVREPASAARRAFFTGSRRTGSSSFQSASRFNGDGDVAIELFAMRRKPGQSKRIVDFADPRHYPHYVVQGDIVFVSGMAVLAPTLGQQLALSLTDVERALVAEDLAWKNVVEVHAFIERGHASSSWLATSLIQAVEVKIPRITIEPVDGLATPGKLLEIEAIAAR